MVLCRYSQNQDLQRMRSLNCCGFDRRRAPKNYKEDEWESDYEDNNNSDDEDEYYSEDDNV